MLTRLGFIGMMALALVAATVTAASATLTRDSQPRNGEWITYSTAPGDNQWRSFPNYGVGSDVFVVRQGRKPMLVAGRRDGKTWNVCPAFSPDGTLLAFGTKSPAGLSLSVVRMTRAGASAARRVHLVVGKGPLPPCPRWSADSSRLAYTRGQKVIVRRLDGSWSRPVAGDPVIQDFRRRYADSFPSPTRDLLARSGVDTPCGVVVERSGGSHRRSLDVGCAYPFYAVAAWSPDGRKLLLMRDVSGRHFTMFAVSVDDPFDAVRIVERVPVNHGRSWPGWGDVSWQPRPS